MGFVRIEIVACLIGIALCSCADPRQEAIDDAYYRGDISSARRRQLTTKLDQERLNEQAESIKRREEDPQGKRIVSPNLGDDNFKEDY